MNGFAFLILVGFIILIVGIIGVIVCSVRHTDKRRWWIVFFLGLVVMIIFFIAFFLTREDETSDTTEETVVEEEVVADEESEPTQDVIEEEVTEEPAEEVVEEPVEEPTEEPAVTWTISDNGILFDENIVSGDAKSVTIEFVYESTPTSVYAQYEFQKVTIGDTSYRVDNDPEDVFVGLPIIAKLNDTQFDFFVPTLGANPDEPFTITYTMNDGSDLPSSIVINYNASETRHSPWTGGNTIDRYSDLTLTIERS